MGLKNFAKTTFDEILSEKKNREQIWGQNSLFLAMRLTHFILSATICYDFKSCSIGELRDFEKLRND